ncbi:hypothetical protein BESB_008930 [Besnoitia besnoiti]|uniref:PHD-finger domain-containing protein n=1 Tax=Besnoitia besnoiti TaxID=94643 RepID=A0A2A9MPE9_BESBE|nr:hypothetical protein BESB_008930 [Besnoitia besnoiti]PFH38551.1 hypothetical protein BESB_008930 [Besnoitia besnoiti]
METRQVLSRVTIGEDDKHSTNEGPTSAESIEGSQLGGTGAAPWRVAVPRTGDQELDTEQAVPSEASHEKKSTDCCRSTEKSEGGSGQRPPPAGCSGTPAAAFSTETSSHTGDDRPNIVPWSCAMKENEGERSKLPENVSSCGSSREHEGDTTPGGPMKEQRVGASSLSAFDALRPVRIEKNGSRHGKEVEDSGPEGAPAPSDPGNDSHCAQCGGGGRLLCCSNCVRSFHSTCLARPEPSSCATFLASPWVCPVCLPTARESTRQQLPNMSAQRDDERLIRGTECESVAAGVVAEGEEITQGQMPCADATDTGQPARGNPQTDRDKGVLQGSKAAPVSDDSSCTGVCHTSEKKEYMATKRRSGGEAVSPRAATNLASSRSPSPSPSHYSRKRRRCEGDTGGTARCKVNIGPRHQVPAVPPFFLDSTCAWDGKAETLSDVQGLYAHDTDDTARLVYSPYAMQRVYKKRLAEGAGDKIIKNTEEMNSFIQCVAQNWTSKSGWQPFSPEYAYKLLHFAGYDPQRAIRIMKDPNFCFTAICDPPQRRYDNKWRPNDRRGQIGTNPYPSPLTLRAYLSKRSQHAAAAFHHGAPRWHE